MGERIPEGPRRLRLHRGALHSRRPDGDDLHRRPRPLPLGASVRPVRLPRSDPLVGLRRAARLLRRQGLREPADPRTAGRVRDRRGDHGSGGSLAAGERAGHVNRPGQETSPDPPQHAHNRVDWYPWSEEARERARREDKPILLSIGYAACHWCHVMEHESFEDEETAALMNEHFVPIKVDREERPDVDAVYMDAVVGITGHGGWPMTVFLTPEGEPFYGGTYYPPEPRHGLPSFKQILLAVSEAWRDRRDEVGRSSAQLAEHIRSGTQLRASTEPLTSELLHLAQLHLRSGFDAQWGGWGRAPKFPPAPVLEFLLRRGEEEM